jgi:hypothetical protein
MTNVYQCMGGTLHLLWNVVGTDLSEVDPVNITRPQEWQGLQYSLLKNQID